MTIGKNTEMILLASSSRAKVSPTLEAATKVFGDARIISVKSESGVSNNPFLILETLDGAITRYNVISTGIEARGIDQILAIESGVIATYKIPANEYFILQLSGKPSLNALQNPDMGSITKTNPVLNISGSVDIKQSPLNYEDRAIQANYQSALYLDRAVAVTYDKKTNTTFIGISRGVAFPPDAVKEAICDNKGKERVSEAMRRNLIKNGLLATDGTILEGPLTGQKFDVQDPHNFLTNCEMSRHMQITEILLAVFEEIKSKRKKFDVV